MTRTVPSIFTLDKHHNIFERNAAYFSCSALYLTHLSQHGSTTESFVNSFHALSEGSFTLVYFRTPLRRKASTKSEYVCLYASTIHLSNKVIYNDEINK